MHPSPQTVTRRRVFYIPGYDPIHPRRYRELYRKEGAAQAAVSGYDLSLSARHGSALYGWDIKGVVEGTSVDASVDVLVWSDIVRDSMNSSIPATYAQLGRTAWIYGSTGALWRLMRLRKGPVIAALYPVAMLLAQLALAGLVCWAVYTLAGLAFAAVFGRLWPGVYVYPAVLLSLPVGGIAGVALLRWFKRRDGRFFAYYLMHDFAFSAAWRGANPPQLEARMSDFGDAIAEALDQDIDEVLVVGHSSGAHLGVSILADLIRAGRVPADGPALSFLSLGQVVPMVAFLPQAHRLRADLRYLSVRDEVVWVDVTAPGDGCAFALCDPVAVSGVAPADKKWPLVVSAAFTQTLSPERWRALRWRFFRLHFQYLCAFDRPGDYDYFRITAGPLTLGARYDGRTPSKSRIETPVNKFTATAA